MASNGKFPGTARQEDAAQRCVTTTCSAQAQSGDQLQNGNLQATIDRLPADPDRDCVAGLYVNSVELTTRDAKERKNFRYVLQGLAACGSRDALQILIKRLEPTEDRDIRHGAIVAIMELGWYAEDAIPATLEMMADEDPLLQWLAMRALGRIATPESIDKPTIEKLVTSLADNRCSIAPSAANALLTLGKQRLLDEIPNLCERLRDRDAATARTSAEVLGEIGFGAEIAIPDLIEGCKVSRPSIQVQCTRALGRIRRRPEVVVPLLIDLLGNPSKKVVAMAAWALGRFGPAAELAVPLLEGLFNQPWSEVAREAMYALKSIQRTGRLAEEDS